MIHGAVGHPKTNYILVAAKFANENLKVVPVNLKSKEAKQLSPLGKFPVTSVDQLNIVDPTAAVRYLHNDSEFFRGTPEDIVLIENWLDFATTELDPAFAAWIDPILGQATPQQGKFDAVVAAAKERLSVIESMLEESDFLVGDVLCLADIAVASSLVFPYKIVLDEGHRAEFQRTTAWFEGMAQRKEFVSIWGQIHLCRASQPWPEPKKPKKAEPKKQAAPKKAAAPAEEAKKPEKKPQNPLELLPPTNLVLDSWKKLYSNAPDKRAAMQEFWSSYWDKEGWSIWKLHYDKLEGECEVVYRTNNQAQGFLQRMESFRKWSFGYLGIYGDEPDLEIMGMFMWRGQDIAQELIDHPQFEYFQPKKLDSEDPEVRALVENYWCDVELETSKVEGRTLQSGYCWK